MYTEFSLHCLESFSGVVDAIVINVILTLQSQDAGYGEKSLFSPEDDNEDSENKVDDEVYRLWLVAYLIVVTVSNLNLSKLENSCILC